VTSPITYEAADALLAARLSPSALTHSRGVAATAGSLAARYGVDVEDARLAGLLHDWDREQTPDQLITAATSQGIELGAADKAVPYLLHSRTGAAALRAALPGLSAEVIAAVARHTVGSADMGDLDKVVYVADMIEPGRAYPGVEELRRLVSTATLTQLFAASYQQSILYLVRSRKRIHPDTVAVWNALVAGETS